MDIKIKGEPKEIADLVLEIQSRQDTKKLKKEMVKLKRLTQPDKIVQIILDNKDKWFKW